MRYWPWQVKMLFLVWPVLLMALFAGVMVQGNFLYPSTVLVFTLTLGVMEFALNFRHTAPLRWQPHNPQAFRKVQSVNLSHGALLSALLLGEVADWFFRLDRPWCTVVLGVLAFISLHAAASSFRVDFDQPTDQPLRGNRALPVQSIPQSPSGSPPPPARP